ncbi:DUF951 domain-containing protein [Salimicrobium humidisoli]|uniref:DUF951 domain-containing protein n=2 Tax=Bacillaceae TaxID=186817 RepID=A0ABX4HRE4_9BACI|nr:DUF951 domain-containing protein [Salimicrobium humidisoli]
MRKESKFRSLVLLCIHEKVQEGCKVEKEYKLNDIVEMKKAHPCGENRWKIIRMGADIRIKCEGCGHSVMVPRREFNKKMKKVLVKAED